MKSFKHYILILAISVLPFISIFSSPLMMHSHDGAMHAVRIAAYDKALIGGQILPRWASDLNYGYGMPLFNFYYHLPYLIGALFVYVGFPIVFTFKLELLLSFLVSGCAMYIFAHKLFKDDTKALIAAVLYQYAPFHLVDLFVRGDTGETFAMALLPLALYFLLRIFEDASAYKDIVRTGFFAALMILSHSAVSLMYFGILLLFAIVAAPDKHKRVNALYALGLSLLLSSFFWVPVLFERRYTYGDLYMKDMYKTHFVPFVHFFIPNVLNARWLQTGGIDVSFGLTQTIALCAGLVMIWRGKIVTSVRVYAVMALALTLVALCMMTNISSFLWGHISILRAFQFPWRFLAMTIFSLAIIGGAALGQKKMPHLLIAVILMLTVGTGAIYMRPPLGFDRVNESSYWNYPLDTTYFGETDLVWSAGHQNSYPKTPFEIISGDGTISDGNKYSIRHVFTVTAKSPVTVLDNTQYYPGWRVYSDSVKIPVEFQDQNHRGLITFRLPPGTHHITVSFGETPLRQVADMLSLTSLIAILIVSSWPHGRQKKQRAYAKN